MSGIPEILVIGALFGPYGLRIKHDPTEHPPKGALRYSGYDAGGILIVKGWIVINTYGPSEVVGDWCLDKVGDPDDTGPQIGRGSLHGKIEDQKLTVTLNPGFAHFNVSLIGIYTGVSFRGTWCYATAKRPVSEGTFAAVRIDRESDERP